MLEQGLAFVGAPQLQLRRAGAQRRAVLVLRFRRAGACPGPRRCLSCISLSRSWLELLFMTLGLAATTLGSP